MTHNFATFAVLVALSGCSNQYRDKVVGDWETTIPNVPRLTMQEGGSGSMTMLVAGQSLKKPLRWRLNGSNLIFKVDGKEGGAIITSIDEQTIKIYDPAVKGDATLKRIGPPPATKAVAVAPPAPPAPKPLPLPVAPPKPKETVAPPNTQGLVAHFRFDEGQGNAAHNDLGRFPAVVQGGRWSPGVKGSAIFLQGNGEHVDLGTVPALNFAAAAEFTLAGWITTTANAGVISSFRHSASASTGIQLSVRKRQLHALVHDDSTGPGSAKVTGAVVADGKWHHIALVRFTDGSIDLFLDGALQGRDKGKSAGPITTDLRALGSDRYPVTAGKKGAPDFVGGIDEFRVFTRALTGGEVSAMTLGKQ